MTGNSLDKYAVIAICPRFGADHLAMALGKLLVTLRTERGLSQDALAVAAGVSTATIAAIEQGRSRRWYPDTARRIFKILMQIAPLTQPQAYQFLDAVRLARSLYQVTLEEVSAERARREATGVGMQLVPPSAVEGEAQVLLDQLKATIGSEQTVVLLRALLATETARRASAHRMVNVRHAPQPGPVPGSVEQRITTYEQVESTSKPAGKPRARKVD